MTIPSVSTQKKMAANQNLIVIEILEHQPGMAPSKTIVRKTKQDVTSSLFSSDDAFSQHAAHEEITLHLALGHMSILIDGKTHLMNKGESLKVPANATRQISGGLGFTLITTYIKATENQVK